MFQSVKFISCLFSFGLLCCSMAAHGQRVIAVQTIEFREEQLWYSCNYIHRSPQANKDRGNTPKLVKLTEKAYEGISKKLPENVKRNKCYRFTFYAKRDSQYVAGADQRSPLELMIFGASAHCGYQELLTKPFEITNTNWKKYELYLRGKSEWSHLNIFAVSSDPAAARSFVLINQQGSLEETYCPYEASLAAMKNRVSEVFTNDPADILSFGGILMMYEISPTSLNVFKKNGEIIQAEDLRKDLAHNTDLDNLLNEFRGIDYLFLILQKNKFRKKRLNLLSYLKTKYPDISKQSKIMLYEELPQFKSRQDKPPGDLLIVENVNAGL
jgi:hypothetical protein